MDDYGFDDDYDDDFYEDCEDMDARDEQDLDEPDEEAGTDENIDEGISLEDFIFWGGYLGINLDEERRVKIKDKKKKNNSDVKDKVR